MLVTKRRQQFQFHAKLRSIQNNQLVVDQHKEPSGSIAADDKDLSNFYEMREEPQQSSRAMLLHFNKSA